MQGARRLLLPHVILLQGLSSIFQAVRYRRAPLMRVLLRLILRSALAHKHMRYLILYSVLPLRIYSHIRLHPARILWPVRLASRSSCSDSRPFGIVDSV